MDERIVGFLDLLRANLTNIPDDEKNDAINYYENFLNDASEEGKDLDEVLSQLDSPESIAETIKTEANFNLAEQNPGFRSFNRVVKNALHTVTTPFTNIMLYLVVALSYVTVAFVFAGAFISLIASVVFGFELIYEAFTIPSKYALEIAGTFGMAFLCAGILFLTAFGLYKLGRLLIRVSLKLVRKVIKKNLKKAPLKNENYPARKLVWSKKIVISSVIISILGLILFSISGLPVKYFTIFNSMKPDNVVTRTTEFNPAEINKISITTQHSCIKILRNKTNKIMVSYEQPDWLDYEIKKSGSMLSFYESSNGSLPLFKISRLHESRTEVTVSIPESYSPGIISAESTGGFISVIDLLENIKAKTYSGQIHITNKNIPDTYNISAGTEVGKIEVNGAKAGNNTGSGIEYFVDHKSPITMDIISSRGDIYISSIK